MLADASRGDVAVLLLNHGAAPDQASIPDFLERIFADRDIIRLPVGPVLQGRLASRIATARTPKVAALYRFMGGGSPLLGYMRAQARLLRDELSGIPVYIGLRYHEPSIRAAVAQAVAAGVRRLVVVPQYPQYSMTTVGSCCAELDRALSEVPEARRPVASYVGAFGTDPAYVSLVAESVRLCLERVPAPVSLVFTAHSVPMRFIDEGDPYRDQIEEQAGLIAADIGRKGGVADGYEIGYQSRTGPVKWLGPETVGVVARLLEEGRRSIALVPLSFVQDHLETLVELDVLVEGDVLSAGGTFVRARPRFCTRSFAKVIAGRVEAVLATDGRTDFHAS